MTTYDFTALSSVDFEELARDILNADLGSRLHSFPPGRDRGIDLREIKDDGTVTIVQCKHYVTSGYSTLLRQCRNEEGDKAAKLDARPYLLVTSVRMSADKRDELRKVFTDRDVRLADSGLWTQDDLNTALGRHPEIEQQHYKLWLSSTAMLQAVLNAGRLQRNNTMLEQAQARQRFWVQIPEYDQARDLLERKGLSVLTGLPGVGKSMLAERLVFDALQDDWDVQLIRGFEEAWSFYRPDETRQVFYFDDVLGDARLREGAADHQREIAAFLHRIKTNKHCKRFIMTSRESILTEAVDRDERLGRTVDELRSAAVSISDQAEEVRTRLVHTHLELSGIQYEEVDSAGARSELREIVGHPAFNPRLVELVAASRSSNETTEDILTDLRRAIHNPAQVWRGSFQTLDPIGQQVLLTLVSLPPGAWHEATIRELSTSEELGIFEWLRTLKRLEPTWIVNGRRGGGRNHVTLANPGCREYLESVLDQGAVAADVIQRVGRLDQLVTLTSIAGLPLRHPSEPLATRRPYLADTLRDKHVHLSQLTREFGTASLEAASSWWAYANAAIDCAHLTTLYGTTHDTFWLLDNIHGWLVDAPPDSSYQGLDIGRALLQLPVDGTDEQKHHVVVRALVDTAIEALPTVESSRHLAAYERFPDRWFKEQSRAALRTHARRILESELSQLVDTADDVSDAEHLERQAHVLQDQAIAYGFELDVSAALARADELSSVPPEE